MAPALTLVQAPRKPPAPPLRAQLTAGPSIEGVDLDKLRETEISRVAPGTSGGVVDFAQRQTFSPAEKIGPVPESAPCRSLQRVLCELLESEINAGLQTFAFDSSRVWIGDELNGLDAIADIRAADAA